jgi:hypothetical protein
MSAQAIAASGVVRQTAYHARLYQSQLIIKDFLTDQLTRQKHVLILWANAGRISDTLFDHSHLLK